MMSYGPLAAAQCPQCPSDSHTPFFVKDPETGELVCTVLRCMVCGFLQIV